MLPRSFPVLRLRASLATACLAAAFLPGTIRAQGFSLDATKREQSRVFYQTVYASSQGVPSGWTGSASPAVAGTTSAPFKDATLRRVCFFRALAGVPAAVTFDDALSAKCQQAALMMSVNNALSHFPPVTWLAYTADGAAAASHSNISWGSNGPAAVDGYLADTGDNNAAVGHRRWVLYPPTTVMGTGDVDGSGKNGAANALWVMADGPRPASVSTRDGFVAWPTLGFVPAPLVPARWSFTLPDADFSGAAVTMTHGGQPAAVALLPVATGSGDNTIVWTPAGLPADASAGDWSCDVAVKNVKAKDGTFHDFSYTVTVFDPMRTGADTVLPALTGPAQTSSGSAASYTFNAVPGATGYQWTARTAAPLTAVLGAENGVGDLTVSPASWNPVISTDGQTGAACYQLNGAAADGIPGSDLSDTASGETLTLNAAVLPAKGATLRFLSRVGFHSADEQALVQVSTDDGQHWANIYQQQDGNGPETAFTPRSVDLSAYAGSVCRVRFAYTIPKTGSYLPRSPISGWFVDEIGFKGAQNLGAGKPATVADGTLGFDWMPPADGAYVLQVTPLFFGAYPADAGPLLAVQAGGPGTTTPQGASVVTLSAPVASVTAGSGGTGSFLLTRTGDLSDDLVVLYAVKGSAKGGVDYTTIPSKKKIKAGKSSTQIKVTPLTVGTGRGNRVVKMILQNGTGYTMGDASSAKVKILGL